MARKQLTPTKKETKGYDKFADEAVFEAEFLALVVEHPHTPNRIRGALRFVLIAALNVLLERLKHYDGDGQMFRDIFPHACVYETEVMVKSYRFILELMEKEPGTKRVLDSITNHTTSGHVPPRYPHPVKELFQKYRKVYVMAGEHHTPDPAHAVPEKVKSPEARTADRLAAVLEDEETPPVVRELIELMCHSLDAHSATPTGKGGDLMPEDYQFKPTANPTPAAIRRKLPKMLRKVGRWKVGDGIAGLWPPDEKGGDAQ
jgi:hypothetical protein